MPEGFVGGLRRMGREASRRAQAMPENRFRREYYDDIARIGRRGEDLGERFTSGISEFSPEMAFQRRLRAHHDQLFDRLGRDVETLRATQTRMGRLNTGFATEDEDRLYRQSLQDLHNTVGSAALQTSGQELDRLGLLGSYADRASERAMAARAGELYSLRDQRAQNTREKRDFWGNIIGSLITAGGGVVGGLLGGPVGAVAGASAGRAVTTSRRPRTDYTGY